MGARIGPGIQGTDGEFFYYMGRVINQIHISRHLAIVGQTGHVSTFDWQTGTLHTELQLQETCRDIT